MFKYAYINDFMNFNWVKRKINILRFMTCAGGKRPLRPQKWSKILKTVQKILARLLEECLPDSFICAFTL